MDEDVRAFGTELGRRAVARDWPAVHAMLAPWLRASWPVDKVQRFFEDESQPQTAANSVTDVKGYVGLRYRYRPPEEVERRIFCTMAKWAGYNDPVAFALVVEGWTPANRRDFLTSFYQWRRDVLSWEANGKEGTSTEIKDEGTAPRDDPKIEDDDEDDEL